MLDFALWLDIKHLSVQKSLAICEKYYPDCRCCSFLIKVECDTTWCYKWSVVVPQRKFFHTNYVLQMWENMLVFYIPQQKSSSSFLGIFQWKLNAKMCIPTHIVNAKSVQVVTVWHILFISSSLESFFCLRESCLVCFADKKVGTDL